MKRIKKRGYDFDNQTRYYRERNERIYGYWLSGMNENKISEKFGLGVEYIRAIINHLRQKEIEEARHEEVTR